MTIVYQPYSPDQARFRQCLVKTKHRCGKERRYNNRRHLMARALRNNKKAKAIQLIYRQKLPAILKLGLGLPRAVVSVILQMVGVGLVLPGEATVLFYFRPLRCLYESRSWNPRFQVYYDVDTLYATKWYPLRRRPETRMYELLSHTYVCPVEKLNDPSPYARHYGLPEQDEAMDMAYDIELHINGYIDGYIT